MAGAPLRLLIARYSLKARELEASKQEIVEKIGRVVREEIVPEVQNQLERGYRVSEIDVYGAHDSFSVSLSLEYEGSLVNDVKDIKRVQNDFKPILERLSKANDLEGIALFFDGEYDPI